MVEGERPKLVDKKGKTSSVVWDHFGYKEDDLNQEHIVCKLCFGPVSVPQGNTTNLFNHLKKYHKVVYDHFTFS